MNPQPKKQLARTPTNAFLEPEASDSRIINPIDALSENADERGEEILGALYEYAEMIAPEA